MRAFLAALLAASALAQPAGDPGAYVHLTTRAWFTFDPAAAFDPVSIIATGNVYEPLITFGDVKKPDSLIPFLAAEVPTLENGLLSADLRTYRFPVRKGVKFHDGRLLTPEDVRYSFLRFMLADEAGGPSALLLEPILGVGSTRDAKGAVSLDFKAAEAAVRVEGEEVVVRLPRPAAAFLRVVASLPIVVSRDWAVEHGEWDGSEGAWKRYNNRPPGASHLTKRMNGTGPYRLAGADGRQLTLERHDGYWRGPAVLGRVLLRVAASKAVRLQMLESGAADSSFFDARDYDDARAVKGVKIVEAPPGGGSGEIVFFTFRTEPGSPFLGSGKLDGRGVPPDFFAQKPVREGFAFALDFEDYLRRGLAGRGRRSSGPIPPGLVLDDAPARAFDLGRAAAALKKAYGGELWNRGFTLTLAYSPSNANRTVLAELLRVGLAKVNPRFVVKVKTLSSQALYAAAERHELPLFIASYDADYPDPHTFAYGLLAGSGYYPSVQRYRNTEIDRLIAVAATMGWGPERMAAYREVTRLAAADVPHVTTYEPVRFTAARENVRGLDSGQNVSNLARDGFPYFYAYSKR
ncbi:MAG: hypothetical protein HYZ75_02695 [Elusimicrobia bacterium]|nr:hypothetical protein [Elusimicrobiota bacterium]